MLRPSSNPFALPDRPPSRHGFALAAAAIGVVLAVAWLVGPFGFPLPADEVQARPLPCGLFFLMGLLVSWLARLLTAEA